VRALATGPSWHTTHQPTRLRVLPRLCLKTRLQPLTRSSPSPQAPGLSICPCPPAPGLSVCPAPRLGLQAEDAHELEPQATTSAANPRRSCGLSAGGPSESPRQGPSAAYCAQKATSSLCRSMRLGRSSRDSDSDAIGRGNRHSGTGSWSRCPGRPAQKAPGVPQPPGSAPAGST
jgi:hypothetical protein